MKSVECYHPSTDTWTPVAEMCVRRSGAGVGVLDGVMYAVGGHDGPEVRNNVEAYRPSTGVWTSVADMHMCRRNAGNFIFILRTLLGIYINVHKYISSVCQLSLKDIYIYI